MRKKSPYLRTGSHLEYGGEGGGLTRFARRYSAHPWASPLRGQRRRCSKTLPAFLSGQPAYCVRGLSNWLRQLSNPGRGFSSPGGCHMRKKARTCVQALISNMAVRGGLTRFARPCGQPARRLAVCPTGCASCRTPVGGSHPPGGCHMRKKSPYLRTGSHLEYGGEGGIDSLRSPLRGSPLAGSQSVQLAAPVVEPRSGVLIPPCGEYKRKKPVLAYRLSSRIWR